jgi:hypothetical protein
VTNGTSQLDVLSLSEVNIRWGSFGWDENILRAKTNTGILPYYDAFSVMATKKNTLDIFLMGGQTHIPLLQFQLYSPAV